MNLFEIACVVFATVAAITALIASWALAETLRAQLDFRHEPSIDAARTRYFRFRVRLGIFRVVVQLLMIAAAVVALINPLHTGVWLLAIFSVAEVFTSGMVISDIWTRRRARSDAMREQI